MLKAQSYDSLLTEIDTVRLKFREAYLNEGSLSQDTILRQAQLYLDSVLIDDVFPIWYGTQWDYNGMTRRPKVGKIACGYFVTNVLTDIGYRIPRIRWAQSASEVFIKTLCKDLRRFYKKPVEDVNAFLLSSGDGVYLVGLDYHTGFMTVDSNKVYFVHSNYYQADIGVMSESIFSDNPLKDSKYRVIGRLFSLEMTKNWILGLAYE